MEVVGDHVILSEEVAIKTTISQRLMEGGSFSLWRMPASTEKVLFICNSGVVELDEVSVEDSEPGFVFAPFQPNQKKLFLKAEMVFAFKENGEIETAHPVLHPDEQSSAHRQNEKKIHFSKNKSTSKNPANYQEVVAKGIQQIEDGILDKIVPSRYKEVNLPEAFDLIEAFETLCKKHPLAFVSIFSSPQSGTWLGATPELLVSVDRESKFRTHALAGTLHYSPEVDLKSVAWTQKEIEEQAMVSRYIINCFKKIRVREYQEHGPKTIVAGNVMHLKTDYVVDMKEINFFQLGSVMLKLLHPTSAICGMPLEPSLKFLSEHEGYNREFYSGYLGALNFHGESSIFVNLRCLQVLEHTVRFYAGAGVTIDSIPSKEMEETEMKMMNLLTLLTKN
ncbi:MAG: chorismate-binding protein [Cyclobacteriaceae bacterium]|nr:chorismate-binding protein [Cyclobacteriaceae bacterium]